MLSQHSLQIIERYWQGHLGYRGTLFAERVRAVSHAGELEGYHGVFTLFREGSVILSAPAPEFDGTPLSPALRAKLQEWLWHGNFLPDGLGAALQPFAARVIGPAFIGYAEAVVAPDHGARSLGSQDASSLDVLRLACDGTEWDHGGSPIENVCSGVFQEGQLVALAGYQVWGGTIAHISTVTHPGFRGRGYGRSAVAHLAQRALEAGLLPQYRTLEGNGASMKIAESLGFVKYATSMAVRL